MIQLPRSGEDLLEERVARDKYLQAKARAEAGEGEMPAPLEQRDVWRIEFPYEAVTVDYDPGSNLLVQANIMWVWTRGAGVLMQTCGIPGAVLHPLGAAALVLEAQPALWARRAARASRSQIRSHRHWL